MNLKILISSVACLGSLFCSGTTSGVKTDPAAAQNTKPAAPFGQTVSNGNPWMDQIDLKISETTKLPENKKKEIIQIEGDILHITKLLQEIQVKLGVNFNGSNSPLTPRELRNLKDLYNEMIANYQNIVGWFGSTDHYYMPLSFDKFAELQRLVNVFAERAGIATRLSSVVNGFLQR